MAWTLASEVKVEVSTQAAMQAARQQSLDITRMMQRELRKAQFWGLVCRLLGHSRTVRRTSYMREYEYSSECRRCYAPPFVREVV